ncbi:hypothetical protein BpHYR1_026990 [Brachionus plicatilis]|uniref:Uncharacterized protein n=1 Tax=Brachionus plicatilis TaxID=10195 RepID=A0A3M7SPV6_BRAPC|nr:hypothetical protein BpHYR1_026990 [Brachionus plicatilis]
MKLFIVYMNCCMLDMFRFKLLSICISFFTNIKINQYKENTVLHNRFDKSKDYLHLESLKLFIFRIRTRFIGYTFHKIVVNFDTDYKICQKKSTFDNLKERFFQDLTTRVIVKVVLSSPFIKIQIRINNELVWLSPKRKSQNLHFKICIFIYCTEFLECDFIIYV